MRRGKAIGTVCGVALLGYFIGLPVFWTAMAPQATVTIQDRWRHDADLPIQIHVKAGHSNFVIREVRVTFTSPPPSGKRILYPRVLHQRPPKNDWTIFEVNRCTWPCSKDLDVSIPLAELTRESGLQAGILTGDIQITIDYVDDLDKGSAFFGTILGTSRTIAIPYVLTLE